MTIIGVSDRQGEYQGRPYHNINFHCSEIIASGKGFGNRVEEIKVKYDRLVEIFGKPLTDKELSAFVGKEVTFLYDKYGSVFQMQVLNS